MENIISYIFFNQYNTVALESLHIPPLKREKNHSLNSEVSQEAHLKSFFAFIPWKDEGRHLWAGLWWQTNGSWVSASLHPNPLNSAAKTWENRRAGVNKYQTKRLGIRLSHRSHQGKWPTPMFVRDATATSLRVFSLKMWLKLFFLKWMEYK